MTSIGFDQHDHKACIHQAMGAAEKLCSDNGLQFTVIRKTVLGILLREHKAMGAYDILAMLNEGSGQSAPPVVYRALDFLVGHGFAHKIENKNAYIACALPGQPHNPAFMICRECDCVVETPTSPSSGFNVDTGFKIETTVLEAVGLCPNCQTKEASTCD